MNKMLAILVATMMSSAAMAENGVSFEFERERSNATGNTMENTVKLAPYVKLDNGVKFDLQVGASRNDDVTSGSNSALSNTAEARVQKMWDIMPGVKLGGRIGIGEVFNGTNSSGKTVDFSYYTIEPKAAYAVTKELSAVASWRFRDALTDTVNYQTRTWKAGFDYAVTKNDEVGVRYFQKRGDSDTNGVELAYTRSF